MDRTLHRFRFTHFALQPEIERGIPKPNTDLDIAYGVETIRCGDQAPKGPIGRGVMKLDRSECG